MNLALTKKELLVIHKALYAQMQDVNAGMIDSEYDATDKKNLNSAFDKVDDLLKTLFK